LVCHEYSPESGWVQPKIIDPINSRQSSIDSACSVGPEGHVLAVWACTPDWGGDALVMRAVKYHPKKGWSSADWLAREGSGSVPHAVVDETGSGYVVWIGNHGTGYTPQFSRVW
jgi:hypothetical protein